MSFWLKIESLQGTIISSCWIVTAAHCFDLVKDFPSGPEFWYRVDAGNRYFQTKYDNRKNQEKQFI